MLKATIVSSPPWNPRRDSSSKDLAILMPGQGRCRPFRVSSSKEVFCPTLCLTHTASNDTLQARLARNAPRSQHDETLSRSLTLLRGTVPEAKSLSDKSLHMERSMCSNVRSSSGFLNMCSSQHCRRPCDFLATQVCSSLADWSLLQ